MFLALLPATLAVSLFICWLVARLFSKSLASVLNRIIRDEIASAWKRYIMFAIYVVGVGSGVQFYKLEQYVEGAGHQKDFVAPVLTGETWILELYRVIINTLQGIAWALLLFYLTTLIAFVIVKRGEMK